MGPSNKINDIVESNKKMSAITKSSSKSVESNKVNDFVKSNKEMPAIPKSSSEYASLEEEKERCAIVKQGNITLFYEIINGFLKNVLDTLAVKKSLKYFLLFIVAIILYIVFIATFGVSVGYDEGKTYIPYGGNYKIQVGMTLQDARDIVGYIISLFFGIIFGKMKP